MVRHEQTAMSLFDCGLCISLNSNFKQSRWEPSSSTLRHCYYGSKFLKTQMISPIWGHTIKHSTNFRSSICLKRKNFKTIDQPRQPPEFKLFSTCWRKAEVSKNDDQKVTFITAISGVYLRLYIYSKMYQWVYLPGNPSLKSAIWKPAGRQRLFKSFWRL